MSEAGLLPEKALLVLQAAVADAGGDPGVHVSRARLMEQTAITDLEEFVGVAEYLAERGFIDEGVNRYELFVTLRGSAWAAGDEGQIPSDGRSLRIDPTPLHVVLPTVLIEARSGPLPRTYRD